MTPAVTARDRRDRHVPRCPSALLGGAAVLAGGGEVGALVDLDVGLRDGHHLIYIYIYIYIGFSVGLRDGHRLPGLRLPGWLLVVAFS